MEKAQVVLSRKPGDRIRAELLDPGLEPVLLGIPGVHRSGVLWSWPPSPAVAGAMVERLRGCAVEFDEGWRSLFDEYERSLEARALLLASELPEHPSRTPSWLHQRQAYQYLSRVQAAGLFADMGTGKSKIVVDLVANLQPRRTLIVCPKKTVGGWVREFERHAIQPVETVALGGSLAERIRSIKAPLGDLPRVYLTNFEAFGYEPMQEAAMGLGWDLLVVDEAHRIKSPSGKVSRYLHTLGQRRARRRLALTGTPASDKPLDVFGIYRFLDPGVFGLSFTQFRDRYAVVEKKTLRGRYQAGKTYDEIIGYRNLDELSERMYSIAFRVTDDILDLPAQQDIVREVVLSPSNLRRYQKMERDSVLELERSEASAVNPVGLLLRLQQMTSGYLPVVDKVSGQPSLERLGSEKAEVLREMLEDLDPAEPVVVFARFVHDLEQIREASLAAGRECREVSGRRDELARWQGESGGQVVAVQLQAGGAGVELQRSRYAVYYSVDFSLTNYEQSRKRVHRPGQTRPVVYYHLITPGTVDEYIYEALRDKKDVTSYLVDGLRRKDATCA